MMPVERSVCAPTMSLGALGATGVWHRRLGPELARAPSVPFNGDFAISTGDNLPFAPVSALDFDVVDFDVVDLDVVEPPRLLSTSVAMARKRCESNSGAPVFMGSRDVTDYPHDH